MRFEGRRFIYLTWPSNLAGVVDPSNSSGVWSSGHLRFHANFKVRVTPRWIFAIRWKLTPSPMTRRCWLSLFVNNDQVGHISLHFFLVIRLHFTFALSDGNFAVRSLLRNDAILLSRGTIFSSRFLFTFRSVYSGYILLDFRCTFRYFQLTTKSNVCKRFENLY